MINKQRATNNPILLLEIHEKFRRPTSAHIISSVLIKCDRENQE